MLLKIENFLSAEQVAQVRAIVDRVELDDGRKTGSAKLKLNRQSLGTLPELEPAQRIIHTAFGGSVDFAVFALPKTYRILFNRYDAGMYYKTHGDQALMGIGTPTLLRSDLSFTVFLSEPGDYDGGVFRLETPFGEQRYKEPAGTLICYPSDLLHEVLPVTRGARHAAVGWIQSLVPEPKERELVRQFDELGRDLLAALPDPEPFRQRLGLMRDALLRRWTRI